MFLMLGYVTCNDRESVLKTSSVNRRHCFPRESSWPRAALTMNSPSSCALLQYSPLTHPSRTHTPPREISSSGLNRVFYFFSLSSRSGPSPPSLSARGSRSGLISFPFFHERQREQKQVSSPIFKKNKKNIGCLFWVLIFSSTFPCFNRIK